MNINININIYIYIYIYTSDWMAGWEGSITCITCRYMHSTRHACLYVLPRNMPFWLKPARGRFLVIQLCGASLRGSC